MCLTAMGLKPMVTAMDMPLCAVFGATMVKSPNCLKVLTRHLRPRAEYPSSLVTRMRIFFCKYNGFFLIFS